MRKDIIECDFCGKQFPYSEMTTAIMTQDTGIDVCLNCKTKYFDIHNKIENGIRKLYDNIHDTILMLSRFIQAIDWKSPDVIKHFGVVAVDIQNYKEQFLSKVTAEDGNVKTE